MTGSAPCPVPRARVEAACRRRGRPAVLAGCAELLTGGTADGDLVLVLAGPSARWADADGELPADWLRVWAARGLLWAWDDTAVTATPAARAALLQALGDGSWRVREMAAKVVARHRVDEALERVVPLVADPVPRVRAAAGRALARLGSGGPRH